jgi:hypothetical protein
MLGVVVGELCGGGEVEVYVEAEASGSRLRLAVPLTIRGECR